MFSFVLSFRSFYSTRAVLAAGLLLATASALALSARAQTATSSKGKGPDAGDFSELVELAPFRVQGQQLAVSIHARSNGDRRYAEKFSEEVMKVVYEGVTPSTGKGLVIIGKKGEPYPIFVFRKFLALAEAGKLDPAVAARGPELFAMLDHWQHTINDGQSAEGEPAGGVDLEFEKIVTALPLPLKGIGAKLYQLAWFEKFDEAKVDAKLRSLKSADLDREVFAHFDWVFYLPPRGAFDQVLDDLIAQAMKEDDVGFFARTAVKTVMLVVKPKIRQAIEGVRRGVMFQTVVQARTSFTKDEISELTAAYIEQFMPDEKKSGAGTEHERAVRSVRAQIRKIHDEAATALRDASPTETEKSAG